MQVIIFVAGSGMHSHAKRGNEVEGHFLPPSSFTEGGNPFPVVDPRIREDDDEELIRPFATATFVEMTKDRESENPLPPMGKTKGPG